MYYEPVNPVHDEPTVDERMASLCNQLKEAEQQAQNTLTYCLREMEYLKKKHGGSRDDIENCISEIKDDVFADESEHWRILDDWAKHFMGVQEKADTGGDNDGD